MMTKKREKEKLRMEMVRYCLIWNMGYEATKAYFWQHGYKLSYSRWKRMKDEINSDADTRNWFSEQALKAMEKDHKLTVEQYTELERILLKEIHQLAMTSPYLIVGEDDDGKPILEPNKNHDVNKLSKAITTFDLIKKSKSDVMVANPVVQAIMIKHEKELGLAQEKARIANVPIKAGLK